MDVKTEPVELETSTQSSTVECRVEQDLRQDCIDSRRGDKIKSRKRPLRDPSTGFTKAVVICNSSELTKSEANTYRPNNIVIELLKKNPMRYGKVTFHKFTSEKEVREELSLRFPILENRTFWFSSADQYGKLNFRELEEWSGRNVRRWLPGSSAMYIILETSSRADYDSEGRSDSELDTDTSTPYSGISFATIRPDTAYPITWRASDSQRALLDFLSSSEKLCNAKKLKMFAINADENKSKPSHSQLSKSPARLDLRSLALYTKNERIGAELDSSISRRRDCSSSGEYLLGETEVMPKKRRTFSSSRSAPSFSTLTGKTCLKSTELEHQQYLKEKHLPSAAQCSYKVKETLPRIHDENPQRNDIKSPKESVISKNTKFERSASSSNGSLESMDETKESITSSRKENIHRDHQDGSRIPGYFSPYYLMPDPRTEQKEKEIKHKVSNGKQLLSASHAAVSPVEAIPVPSAGFFPLGQDRQGCAMYLPDKGPSLGFIPLEVLHQYSRLFPYRLAGSTTAVRNAALGNDISYMNNKDQNTNNTNVHVKKEEKLNSVQSPKDLPYACSEGSIEAHRFTPNNITKERDGVRMLRSQGKAGGSQESLDAKKRKNEGKSDNLVQKLIDITELEKKKKEQNLKYNCEMFPCSGPCKSGTSFVVVLSQPLEDRFNQASFCANFDDTSMVELTRVDHSTLKGKSIPGSQESGHVTVQILANDHVIGNTCFTYEEGFIHGLKNAMFSGEHGETLLKFLTSTEKERHDMQDDLVDWLELVVFMSTQIGCTSVIEKVLGSSYGEAVKDQCSRRTTEHLQLALNSRHAAEHSRYLKAKLNRNDLENEQCVKLEEAAGHVDAVAHDDSEPETYSSLSSESNSSAHAYDCDESRLADLKHEEKDSTLDYKADNLMLLSSIASRMGKNAATDGERESISSKAVSNGRTTSTTTATTTLKEEKCGDGSHSREEEGPPLNLYGGFLKKVFVLPPNSQYLPSQSELCKLRGTRSSYCKVLFNAEMNEDYVFGQIRRAFDDLVDTSFRLAVVDQTGKLVFYDGIWTGKIIRRKLRGNSVLYVVPVDENQD